MLNLVKKLIYIHCRPNFGGGAGSADWKMHLRLCNVGTGTLYNVHCTWHILQTVPARRTAVPAYWREGMLTCVQLLQVYEMPEPGDAARGCAGGTRHWQRVSCYEKSSYKQFLNRSCGSNVDHCNDSNP